jgi:hypothetical protein
MNPMPVVCAYKLESFILVIEKRKARIKNRKKTLPPYPGFKIHMLGKLFNNGVQELKFESRPT